MDYDGVNPNLRVSSLPFAFKKVFNQLRAFVFVDAAGYEGFRVGDGLVYPTKAALGIVSAKNNAPYLEPVRCARAHHTRLKGNIKRALGQVFTAHKVSSRGKRLHFCMCRYII